MRKQQLLLTWVMLAFTAICFSQKPVVQQTCIAGELMQKRIRENPELLEKIRQVDKAILDKNTARPIGTDGNTTNTGPGAVLTIPVVIYVVYDPANPASNISMNQVNSQLNALNTYFDPYNIKFCVATKNGSVALTGINYINNAALSNHDSGSEQQSLQQLAPVVPKERYLRIWVVNTIDGPNSPVQGYSEFPGFNPFFDGVVIKYNVFGDAATCVGCPLQPTLNQGKTLVHEIGHYLNLFHTFEGACAGMSSPACYYEGDHVCDTPPVNAPNLSCAPGSNSCAENPNLPDLIHNYMDYGTHACVDSFTQGQKDRMFQTLTDLRPILCSPDNIGHTQVCGYQNVVSANFTPSTYSPCSGSGVTFTTASNPNITYQWNFGDTGSSSNTATGPVVTHTFNTAATSFYTVTLTATNNTTQATAVSTAQIYVNTCNPISSSEGLWYFPYSNGLNFSSGTAVSDTSIPQGDIFRESVAIQNTPTGNLLFYTNGINVYNNQHAVINSGTPLAGHRGARDGVIIVPDPVLSNQYYIFTNFASDAMTMPEQGFRYSKVSVSGTSATMTATVNQPITIPAGYVTANSAGAVQANEGIAAMQSCGGYFVLTILKKNSQYFIVVYELKPNAAGTASELVVKSEYAMPTNILYTIWSYGGGLKFAPNGNKLAVTLRNNEIYLFDFDKISGTISDMKFLPIPFRNIFGISFSPDSNLLYVSGTQFVYQYNLNALDVAASQIQIVDTPIPDYNTNPLTGNMQLGPDNKLYMIKNNKTSVAVIHTPNNICSANDKNACNYSNNGPAVRDLCSFGMPNFIIAKNGTAYTTPISISTYRTGCKSYKFFPNVCGVGLKWNVTGPSTSVTTTINDLPYTFTNNGLYTIKLMDASNNILATTTVTIANIPVPQISGSTTACLTTANNDITNNSVTLAQGQTVAWTITSGTGAIVGASNHASVMVNWDTLPGTIKATVTNAFGCSTEVTRTITSYCECNCLSTASFTAANTGNTVTFTSSHANSNQLCGNVNVVHYWTFGDGTSSMAYNPVHTYSVAGAYTVTMESRILGTKDEILCQGTVTNQINTNNSGTRGRIANFGELTSDLISVYPNPAKDKLNIGFQLENTSSVRFTIRSLDGKQLGNYTAEFPKGNQTYVIDLPATLADEMILLEIEAGGESVTKKIMIKK